MKPILCVFLLFPFLAHGEEFTRTRILMGNVPVTLTVDAPASARLQSFITMEKAYTEAIRIENAVSDFKENSDTSRLNRQAGKKWVKIGPDLLRLLILSRRISKATGGAFDITFKSTDPHASFKDVLIDRKKSRAFLRREKISIGVSSIAKGYIVDRMSDILLKKGFARHIVNAGGDIRAQGRWKIAVRNPRGGLPPLSFDLANRAISTSGTYERGHHIFNPINHRPVKNRGSATVIASQSVLASPLATAAFVLGEKKARVTFKKMKNVRLIFL